MAPWYCQTNDGFRGSIRISYGAFATVLLLRCSSRQKFESYATRAQKSTWPNHSRRRISSENKLSNDYSPWDKNIRHRGGETEALPFGELSLRQAESYPIINLETWRSGHIRPGRIFANRKGKGLPRWVSWKGIVEDGLLLEMTNWCTHATKKGSGSQTWGGWAGLVLG